MNHQMNIDEAIAIAKEYHLEATESQRCKDQHFIKINNYIKRSNIMKTRKHFIRKYELLARCIQTNLELFILQQ